MGHRWGVHAWVFDIAGPRNGAVRSHFSPNPGTGPSAALRGRGRIGSDSGLAAGCVAGTSSRGRRRRARCGPVVRLLQRAVLLEVGEDGADGGGFLDAGVLDELPARTEITYKVPLSEAEAHQYEALRQQAVDNLSAPDEERSPLQVLTEITRLRRFCCHPSLVIPGSPLSSSKLQAFAEIVEELLENRHKALVFSQFVDHLNIVRAWLDKRGIHYQYLDGATPAKERQKRVNAFQAGEGEIFLISLKAGGSGLNLTAADYVIHLDPWWNPAVEDQASDRAHRMGQKRPVTIYRLVTENTIEEQIVSLHARKRDLASSLLEGGEMSGKLDADALLALLKGQ
ncbi:TPA: hypothetical protein L4E86_006784 [Pseudomonas aeruginosa]|nr:hypothetical protein [Pseudomonas aeruginosa]